MPYAERGLDVIVDQVDQINGQSPPGQSKGHTQKQYAQRPPGHTNLAPAITAQPEAPLDNVAEENQQADYGPAQFLADIAHPESEAREVIAEALCRLPHYRQARRIAIAGNSLMAAGAALALSQQGEKTCLLEYGHEAQQAQIASLVNFDAAIGVADVLKKTIPLDNLIITARIYRPNPNCYVLPQGRLRADWSAHQGAFASLINALSRKFHRIIISTPSLDRAAAQALAQAGIGWILADAENPVNARAAETLQQNGCSIHVL